MEKDENKSDPDLVERESNISEDEQPKYMKKKRKTNEEDIKSNKDENEVREKDNKDDEDNSEVDILKVKKRR